MPTTYSPSADPGRYSARPRASPVWLWGPAGVALVVRLTLYLASGGWSVNEAHVAMQSDAAEYHVLARSLAEEGRFRYDESSTVGRLWRPRWEVEPIRTPVYPAFVAAFYAAAGPRPGFPVAAQFLLEAATCLLLAWSLRGLLGGAAAGLAAMVYAVHPGAALFSNLLYSEALFTLLMVAGFASLIGGDRPATPGPSSVRLAVAGALLGAAALTRPVLLYLPVAFAMMFLTLHGRRRRTLISLLAFTAAFASAVLPWAARNAERHGHFAVSTSGAFNLLALYAAPAEAAATARPATDVLDERLAEADSIARLGGPVRSDFDRARHWRVQARQAVLAHPAAFARTQLQGVVRLFVSTGRMYRPFVLGGSAQRPPADGLGSLLRWWWRQPGYHRVMDVWVLLFFLGVYPLVAVGAWEVARGRGGLAGVVAATLVLYLMIATGTPGHSRLMMPLIPFVAVIATLGAGRLHPPAARPPATTNPASLNRGRRGWL